MARNPNCPACRGAMKEGYLPDHSQGTWLQASWCAGAPEERTIFGVQTGVKKVDRKGLLPIEAWRCSSCGLVQLYAPGKPPKR